MVELAGVTIPLDPIQLSILAALVVIFVVTGGFIRDPRNRRGGVRALTALGIGNLLPVAAVALVIAYGLWSFDGLYGLSRGQLVSVGVVVTIALYVVATSQEELSLPFWLTFVPLVIVVLQVLVPDAIASAFDPVYTAIGVDPETLDGVRLLVLGTAATLVYWVVSLRAGDGSNNADTIAGKILGSGRDGRKGALTKLVEEYVTIGRLVLSFGLAVGVLALVQGGTLSTELASFAGDAPVVVSNLLAAVVGFFAAGGDLPGVLAGVPGLSALAEGLQNLSPTAYLFLVILLLAIAYGAREQLQDFESTLSRERSKRRAAEDENEAFREYLGIDEDD